MAKNILPSPTTTTAALLQWWFGPRERQRRTDPGFLERQRLAILNTIGAHEAPNAAAPRPAQRVHRVGLTCGTDQIRVTLALLIWQLLNQRDAKAARTDDGRFTSHFLLVAPHPCVRSRLFDALAGKASAGGYGERRFDNSDLVRLAPTLIPQDRREEVFDFMRRHTGTGTRALRQAQGDGVVAIADGRLEALECLARLSPDAMVFDDETRAPYCARGEGPLTGQTWRHHLRRVATSRNGCGVQVVFTADAPDTSAPSAPTTPPYPG